MNDVRIELLISKLRKELEGLTSKEALEDRIREVHAHIEDAVSEFRALGVEDPIGAALQSFGTVDTYSASVKSAGDGVLLRNSSLDVLKWMAVALLVPISADLLMDFSTKYTGLDSSLALLDLPVCIYVLYRVFRSSLNSRKLLLLQTTAVTAICFLSFAGLGGLSRGVTKSSMSAPRGTAVAARDSILQFSIPSDLAILDWRKKGYQISYNDKPTHAVGLYRTAFGYQSLKREVTSPRSTSISMEVTPSYEAAHKTWKAIGPEMILSDKLARDGHLDMVRDYNEIIQSSWLDSVRGDWHQKFPMALISWIGLLAIHGFGVGIGVVIRSRHRQRPTAV